MPALYYAGPLFTQAERSWNTANVLHLRTQLSTILVHMPQEFCADFDKDQSGVDYARIYATCLSYLDRSQAVLAILDGPDADSGTSFEIGYAVAHGLPIIGFRTDWRPGEDGGANCMLTRSCRAMCTTLDQVLVAVHQLWPA